MRSSLPPSTNRATSCVSADSTPIAGLDGLRVLLNEWKEQGTKTKEEVKQPGEHGITKDQRDAAMKSVYSQYHKMAAQEDKDLVARWTETLNSLLTFAGLLSAVITVFVIAAQPGLQTPPNTSTNEILRHIAQTLNNTTPIPDLVEDPRIFESAIWASAYLYASLGCSLISAFGSLVSKQWVLHLQSNLVGPNTMEEQCHLREVQAYGLSKWKMSTIIESLPLLLQLSVFLFYLGLNESLSYMPRPLGVVAFSFVAITAGFYVLTLVAGTFFASCPFKSPVTNSRIVVIIVVALVTMATALSLLHFELTRAVCLCGCVFLGGPLVFEGINTTFKDGERGLIQESRGTSGVMFWWLMGRSLEERPMGTEMRVVVDTLQATPTDTMEMATWRSGFGRWCSQAFRALNDGWTSETGFRHADIVCHFMHRPDKCTKVIRRALKAYRLYRPRVPKASTYICNTIRNGWTSRLGESTPMPVLRMQPVTLAVYLYHQLIDWVYAEEFRKRSYLELVLQKLPFRLQPKWIYGKGPEERLSSNLLLQELPAALQPQYFSDAGQFSDSIVNAVALAAIALIPNDNLPYLKQVQGLVNSKQPERLLQAVHRLSYYPTDQVPSKLFSLVVAAASRVILSIKEARELYECVSWRSGELGESLYRLLRLGRAWWHAEADPGGSSPGALLVHEVHCLMHIVVWHAINGYRTGGTKMLSHSPEDMQEIFTTYGHPSGPGSVSLKHSKEATELLHLILDLRYLNVSADPAITSRLLRPWSNPGISWSKTPSFTFNPAEHPYVIRQLIHNLNTASDHPRLRFACLSIVVKCRDLFLPGALRAQFPDVASDLDSLAGEIRYKDDLSIEIPWQSYGSFNRWDELSSALEEHERIVGLLKPQAQSTRVSYRGSSSSANIV